MAEMAAKTTLDSAKSVSAPQPAARAPQGQAPKTYLTLLSTSNPRLPVQRTKLSVFNFSDVSAWVPLLTKSSTGGIDDGIGKPSARGLSISQD